MRLAIRTGILTALALLSACDRRRDVGPVVVSVIGDPPVLMDAARSARAEPDRILAGGTAQGLVRFDAAGQVEPGLAARWIVIDDGRTYIFRLRHAHWADDDPVLARDVVIALKRQIGASSRNPLAPYLTAIDAVVEMTPDVIEIDLKRPRPDLLKLFAQPEMAILKARPVEGTGPYREGSRYGASPLLTPVLDPDIAADEQHEALPEENVRLVGERAARAILRFEAKESDMVTGGTVADWPLIRVAQVAPANIRLDPAAGLFGLAVTDRTGFLGDPVGRAAVAQAIDRDALIAAFTREWSSSERILPEQLDSAAPAALPAWAGLSSADRRVAARNAVASWKNGHPGAPSLRLALPGGAGGTILWGRLAADLLAIGVSPVRVGWGDPADLRLIDRVAPYDGARWYLANACIDCGPAGMEAIEAARIAPTLADRAADIARADAALAADGGFIPIARPLRWSLVALRLKAWQPNARAWHPLNHLRPDPK